MRGASSVNKQAVCILLECILVLKFRFVHGQCDVKFQSISYVDLFAMSIV